MADSKYCSDLPSQQHDECLWLQSFVLATVLHLQYNKSIPFQFSDKPVCAFSLSILLSCPNPPFSSCFTPRAISRRILPSDPGLFQERFLHGTVACSGIRLLAQCLEMLQKKLNVIKLNAPNVKRWGCISVLRANLSALMDFHLTRGHSWSFQFSLKFNTQKYLSAALFIFCCVKKNPMFLDSWIMAASK